MRPTFSRITWISLVMVLALAAISLPASAQDIELDALIAGPARRGSPEAAEPLPCPSDRRADGMVGDDATPHARSQKQQETWLGRTNLPGPQRKIGAAEALARGRPRVPGSKIRSKRIVGSNQRRITRRLAGARRCPGVSQLQPRGSHPQWLQVERHGGQYCAERQVRLLYRQLVRSPVDQRRPRPGTT